MIHYASMDRALLDAENATSLALDADELERFCREHEQLPGVTSLDLDDDVKSVPRELLAIHRLTTLSFSGPLARFPVELAALPALECLYLYDGKKIKAIPAEIARFPALRELTIREANLADVPAELGSLAHLEDLELSLGVVADPEAMGATLARLPALRALELTPVGGRTKQKGLRRIPASLLRAASLTKLRIPWSLDELPRNLGQLRSLRVLEIPRGSLKALPDDIGGLGALEELDMSGHDVVTLPASLGELRSLKKLNASVGRLEKLPDSLFLLPALHEVCVNNNRLRALPETLGHCRSLRSLDIERNPLEALPASFGKLTELTTLALGCTSMGELPESLRHLSGLTELRVEGSSGGEWTKRPTRVPSWLGELENLEILSIRENPITSVPPSIGRLRKLRVLDIVRGKLAPLPIEIGQCTALEKLSLCECGLGQLPEELSKLANLKEIDVRANGLTRMPTDLGGFTELGRWSIYIFDGNDFSEGEKARIKEAIPQAS